MDFVGTVKWKEHYIFYVSQCHNIVTCVFAIASGYLPRGQTTDGNTLLAYIEDLLQLWCSELL